MGKRPRIESDLDPTVSGWYLSNAMKKYVSERNSCLRGETTFEKCCFPMKSVRITPTQLEKSVAHKSGGQTASPPPFRVFQLFLPVATNCAASRDLSSAEGV